MTSSSIRICFRRPLVRKRDFLCKKWTENRVTPSQKYRFFKKVFLREIMTTLAETIEFLYEIYLKKE